jgi:hypothetical protein
LLRDALPTDRCARRPFRDKLNQPADASLPSPERGLDLLAVARAGRLEDDAGRDEPVDPIERRRIGTARPASLKSGGCLSWLRLRLLVAAPFGVGGAG